MKIYSIIVLSSFLKCFYSSPALTNSANLAGKGTFFGSTNKFPDTSKNLLLRNSSLNFVAPNKRLNLTNSAKNDAMDLKLDTKNIKMKTFVPKVGQNAQFQTDNNNSDGENAQRRRPFGEYWAAVLRHFGSSLEKVPAGTISRILQATIRALPNQIAKFNSQWSLGHFVVRQNNGATEWNTEELEGDAQVELAEHVVSRTEHSGQVGDQQPVGNPIVWLKDRLFNRYGETLNAPDPEKLERSAGLLIYRQNGYKIEYLLLQASYEPYHWSPPKGCVDAGEDEFTAAVREVKEESGIDASKLTVHEDFKHQMFYTAISYRSYRVKQKQVIFWLASTGDPNLAVTLSDEHRGWCWAKLSDAVELAKYKGMKKMLIAAEIYLLEKSMGKRKN